MPVAPPASLSATDVTLRPLRGTDASTVATYAREPDALTGVWLPLGASPPDPDLWAAWFVQEARMGWSALGGRYGGGLAIDIDTRSFAGWVNFVPTRDDAVELSYGVAPAYRGRGVATAAARLAADWALSAGFAVVELEIAAHHLESKRVAVKAGYSLTERFTKTIGATGETYDDLRFARTS